jgi:hypothetical protein
LLDPLVSADDRAPSPHRALANLSLIPPRDLPRYLTELRRFAEIRNDRETMEMLSAGSDALREGGERSMWAAILKQQRQLHPDSPTYQIVQAEAALGMRDDALRDLATLANERKSSLVAIGVDPLFDSIRQSSKFQQIEASTGLLPSSKAN